MLDFVSIETKQTRTFIEVYPEFIVKHSNDLMIKGKSFYAVWDEESGFWTKNEGDVQRLVDQMIFKYVKENNIYGQKYYKLLKNFSSNSWNTWQKYCKSLPDNYHELDKKIIFSNMDVQKEDYVTKTLDYPISESPIPAYEELMNTLYEPSERQKIEWAIGSIISGDSKELQKFMVLYGGPGTGKSTVLNIIQDLFPGYYSFFDSKALGSNSNFALEPFRDNPLIAIEHDGNLSKIEDNTKLNSIVSHETMVINEKNKSLYTMKFRSFLFMGTNKPVRITDAKSGILRRLIDVNPSGNIIPKNRYDTIKNQIRFELSGIAYHCLKVYENLGKDYYNSYTPINMMGVTNDFYNFMEDNFDFFKDEGTEGIGLRTAWLRYKEYCADANVSYPYNMRLFKDELKNYFRHFYDRYKGGRSVYVGFLTDKFQYVSVNEEMEEYVDDETVKENWLELKEQASLFDEMFVNYPAQYASKKETPLKAWDDVKSVLGELDSSKLHYVRPNENLIVIDFDLKDEHGEKSLERNLEAAKNWPRTYAEVSKGGNGLHLHYYYDGDVDNLSYVYSEGIEIKVFTGKSSLRRKLSICNTIPIAILNSGLPLKGEKKLLKEEVIKSEKSLRDLIKRNLRKEIHPNTKPSIDFIYKILEESYESGLKYDVTDLRPAVQTFALRSTNQSDYCLRMVSKMKFQSEEISENTENYKNDAPIVFFDVEVFPNVFIVCWKKQGKDSNTVRMINPKPEEVEELTKFKLIGFNCRKYDNHILYGRMMGYNNEQLFKLSHRIIVEKDKNAFFGEAYNLSYTDIYDYCSNVNKMSLKKWEIKLGIKHHEFPYKWDEPLPEDKWEECADYCCDDVDAAEKVFEATEGDWIARQILALLSGLTVNDTTNSHTTKIIVGNDKNPQEQFVYTDLSNIFPGYRYDPYGIDKNEYNEGTKIVSGKSIYRGEDPGEGGYVFAQPGIYINGVVLDVESMHPHSAIWLNIFGDKYTKRFENLVEARVLIKHKDYDNAKLLLEYILDSLDKIGILEEYLSDPLKAKSLANALKTAINAVYGLTSATFPNKLKDPKNKDNIVAKYGALFMINLKHEVQERGYTVIHIKTDSIKIANADNEIIQFVKEYGKQYGYNFVHESTYSKMCLVNDAVYIAKYADSEWCKERYGYIPENNEEHPNEWTATGTQFAVPYVFKTLFSKEPILFEDLCETKSVTSSLYLDFNENLPELPFDENGDSIKEEDRHDYRFVGRVGLFCPVKEGIGGAILLREQNGKYYAAVGTKKANGEPYRWMESDMVKTLGKESDINLDYYNDLVNKAKDEISKYGDFEWFVSDDVESMDWMKIPEDDREEIPFEEVMNPPAA